MMFQNLLILLALVLELSATDLYLDPAGKAGSCTKTAPCLNFHQALQNSVADGSRIYMRDGVYSGSDNTLTGLNIPNDLTIAQDPETTGIPVIDLTNTPQFYVSKASDGSTMNFYNILFQNAQQSEQRGGVFNFADRDYNTSSVYNFEGCTFSSCSAEHGGVFWVGYFNSLNLMNCRFLNNTAEKSGGIFSGKAEINVNATDTLFSSCTAQNGGCFYFQDQSNFIANNVTIENNRVTYSGGFMFMEQYIFVYINASYIRNCFANQDGGVFWGFRSEIEFVNSTVTENSAIGLGGVARIFGNGGAIFSYDSTFTKNRAIVEGGVFDVQEGSFLRVNASTFIANSAAGSGGAIALLTEAKANFTNTFAAENWANHGGFMRIYYRAQTFFKGITLVRNAANATGGAIDCGNGIIRFRGNNTIEDNILTPGDQNQTKGSTPQFYCNNVPNNAWCRTTVDDENKAWENFCPQPEGGSSKDRWAWLKYTAIAMAIAASLSCVLCIGLFIWARRTKKQQVASDFDYSSLNNDEPSHLDD